MANKKVVSVLSTAAIGTLIATAVGSTVFAAVDGLVVKNAAGAYLNYDLDALKASVVNDALGQAGAELYKDFDAARTAGSIVSYHDNKVGFVDSAAVQKAALDAALAGTNFALDTFTESSKETVLPATVYQATVTNGKVVAGAEVKPTGTATSVVGVTSINVNNKALNGSTAVSVRPTIEIQLSGDIDATKVTNDNIVLTNAAGTKITVALAYNSTTKLAKITIPTGVSLSDNTEYTLTVSKNIGISADSVSKFTTGSGLAVTMTTPVANADVAGNTVNVTFNKAIDINTANTTNIKLYNNTEKVYEPITIAANGTNGITVTATNGLNLRNESFTLTVSKNVLAISGVALEDNYSLSFVDAVAATVGANAVDSTTNVYGKITSSLAGLAFRYAVQFNQEMDASTITKDTVILREKTTGAVADYTLSYDVNSRYATIVPAADLKEGTQYEVVFKKEIKNSLGIQLSTTTDVVRTFTTADLTSPTVVSVTPGTGSTGVATNPTFAITFSEPVNPATVVKASGAGDFNAVGANTATIMLKKADGTTVDITAAGWTGAFDPTSNNTVYKITAPVGGLTVNTTYTLSVKGYNATHGANIADASARINKLVNRTDATFTTGAGDVTGPTVTAVKNGTTTLATGATNIDPTTTTLDAYLSENITTADAATAGNITITNLATGQTFNAAAAAITATNAGLTSKIAINLNTVNGGVALAADTKYRLNISGIRDNSANTNAMASSYSFDFTTQDAATAVKTFDVTGVGGASFGALATASKGSYVFTADSDSDGVLTTGDAVTNLKNATGVLVNSPLVVKFTDNVTNVTKDTVKLTDADGNAVEGTITVNSSNDGFTFYPTANLKNGTNYCLNITAGVTDDVANPLADTKLYFTTKAAAVVPTVTWSNIEDGNLIKHIDRDSAVVITFNGTITTGGGAAAADTVANYTMFKDVDADGVLEIGDGDAAVTFKLVTSATNKTATLYPDAILADDTVYSVVVANTITVGGNALSTNNLANLIGTFKAKGAAEATLTNTFLGIESAKYNATTRILTLKFDRVLDANTAQIVANYTLNGGALNLIGTPVLAADGKTVSMVLNSTTGAIMPGTSTITPTNVVGPAAVEYQTNGGTTAFGANAVTIVAE